MSRGLAQHAGDYATVKRVRSRRSGRVTFIEVVLGFDISLTVDDVDRRVRSITATIQAAVEGSDVLIVPSSIDSALPAQAVTGSRGKV